MSGAAEFINSLSQNFSAFSNASSSKTNDGLDGNVIFIDKTTKEISFSGTGETLLLLRANSSKLGCLQNGKEVVLSTEEESGTFGLFRIKSGVGSIGLGKVLKVARETRFTLESRDQFFLYSDGVIDQFDHEGTERFGSKRLWDLLLKEADSPITDRAGKLALTLAEFRKNQMQVNDMLCLAIEF